MAKYLHARAPAQGVGGDAAAEAEGSGRAVAGTAGGGLEGGLPVVGYRAEGTEGGQGQALMPDIGQGAGRWSEVGDEESGFGADCAWGGRGAVQESVVASRAAMGLAEEEVGGGGRGAAKPRLWSASSVEGRAAPARVAWAAGLEEEGGRGGGAAGKGKGKPVKRTKSLRWNVDERLELGRSASEGGPMRPASSPGARRGGLIMGHTIASFVDLATSRLISVPSGTRLCVYHVSRCLAGGFVFYSLSSICHGWGVWAGTG